MDEEAPAELVFRANKRRKFVRKRAESEEDVETASHADNEKDLITNRSTPSDDLSTPAVRFQRKPVFRKHGIAFSSKANKRGDAEDDDVGTLLVPVQGNGQQEAIQGDRFVRPTGRVAVAEDKHMTAFIDSKLAEARSATPIAADSTDAPPSADGHQASGDYGDHGSRSIATSLPPPALKTDDKTFHDAQARSTRVYQRPTKRRQPQRDQSDIARDSMIDQIMHETQVPLYAQPASRTAAVDGDEGDNDAAAAEAFKAQLIAEIQMQKPRRGPKAASKDAKTSTGPKLGGSRAQREKMKALEEAKSGGAKK